MTSTAAGEAGPSQPRRIFLVQAATGLGAGLPFEPPAAAQSYPPAIDYTSILRTRFFETGQISFGDVDIVFAPPPPADVGVSVRKADGTVIGQFGYFPDYVFADKAFARVRVRGPADVRLPGPGDYLIEFTVNGRPATRFPFTVRAAAAGGGDPFDPARGVQFDGPWRRLGFLITRQVGQSRLVDLVFWTGGADLPPGRQKDQSVARLLRDGTLIGHSKRAQGHLAAGPFKESIHAFFAPHDGRQAHAAPAIPLDQFLADGRYEIRIERQSDGGLLRAFRFAASGGRIGALPRSALGYAPAVDFLAPRVFATNTGQYQFREAIWLGDERG